MKLPLEGRWLGLIAAVAVVFTGGLMLAVRFIQLPKREVRQAPVTTGIGIARLDGKAARAILKEQDLLDPDPLFLPTSLNASQPELPALIRGEPGTAFPLVSPKYAYTSATAEILFPEVITIPERPVEALTYGRTESSYALMGRFARVEEPLAARRAVVEIVRAKTGEVVLTQALNPPESPAVLVTADWRPLEMLAAVDVTGIIGVPVLSQTSGIEAVDSFFRSYLAKQFHLGERLPPGLYLVRVGP
jgi:hypothetical protein